MYYSISISFLKMYGNNNGYNQPMGGPGYGAPIGQPMGGQPGYGAPMGQPVGGYGAPMMAPAPMMGGYGVPKPFFVSRFPEPIVCPYCGQTGSSVVTYDIGQGTWLLGLILCCFGCVPCACVPCCLDDCKDAFHSCPNCRQLLGVKRYLTD